MDFVVVHSSGFLVHNPQQALEVDKETHVSGIPWNIARDRFSLNSPVLIYAGNSKVSEERFINVLPGDFYNVETFEIVPLMEKLPFGYGQSHPTVLPLSPRAQSLDIPRYFPTVEEGYLHVVRPDLVVPGEYAFGYFRETKMC